MKPLLLLIIGLNLYSVSLTAQNSQDKESVKKVVIAFQEDFNDGSFKNAPSYTTTDWEHINPGGGIDKGRDNVIKGVQGAHQTFLKNVKMRMESLDIRFLTPDVAIADAVHDIDPYTTPDGVKHKNEKQMKTYVLVKKTGNWLLAHDHNTIINSK